GVFERSGEVHVWDVAAGRDVFILRGHTSNVSALAFSPDGQRLASGGHERPIKLWDMDKGDETLTLRGHTSGILGLVFSPDRRWLASSSVDWTVRIEDGRPLGLEASSSSSRHDR